LTRYGSNPACRTIKTSCPTNVSVVEPVADGDRDPPSSLQAQRSLDVGMVASGRFVAEVGCHGHVGGAVASGMVCVRLPLRRALGMQHRCWGALIPTIGVAGGFANG
jgi:hypothetical protein